MIENLKIGGVAGMGWREDINEMAGDGELAVPSERWDQVHTLCEVLEKWGYAPQPRVEPPDEVAIEWESEEGEKLFAITIAGDGFYWIYDDQAADQPREGV